ncbi:MAG: MATE family efflux transporter, partial [Saprospiraceae bacterium]|nr:MATE family efflux transporter [Saprospiraceae bacterium]
MDPIKDKTNKALLAMSVPIALGMLSTFLFQVIDTYFVGQLGAEALAALSFASTLYFLMIGIFIGLAVGVSILVGKAFGAGDQVLVKQVTIIALGIGLLFTLVLVGVGIFSLDAMFQLMGAEAEILAMIKQYLVPLLLGMPLLSLALVGGGVLRATGNVLPPEILMAIAGVLNLIFDYLLIFGYGGFPKMGIEGAAWATVISWGFACFSMIILLWKKHLLAVNQLKWPVWQKTIRQIFGLSTPTIIHQMIGPLTLMYLTFLLAMVSPQAVAAFGIAGRIETLLMIGILGVSTALTPFIAQNVGAKRKERVEEAIVFGGKASTYLGLAVAFFLFLSIRPIAKLFSDDISIIQQTSQYFYIVSLSYILYGLYLVTSSIFNGLERPSEA